jgi:MarR family transcriptional regulator, organic hydroperoxide resistance regulator
MAYDWSVDDQEAFFECRPERMPLTKLLSWTGAALTRHYQRAVAQHGLSPTALGVLGVLGRRDGISHRELAGHLGLTPASLTPVVDALEAAGEVRRTRDADDRRVVRLALTPAGHDRLTSTFARVATGVGERLPRPSPAEEAVIREYLLAVLAAVADEETRAR